MWRTFIIIILIVYAGILSIPVVMLSAQKEQAPTAVHEVAGTEASAQYNEDEPVLDEQTQYISKEGLHGISQWVQVLSSRDTVLTVIVIFGTLLAVVGYLSLGFIIAFWMIRT